jgi:iron complex transport system ATP-binding protein
VLLSTHDPDHALLVASRVAVMAEGGLTAVGPTNDVVTGAMLSRIYGATVRVEETTPSGQRVCVPAWGKK